MVQESLKRKALAAELAEQERDLQRLRKENRELQERCERERTERLAAVGELEERKNRVFNLEHRLSEMEMERMGRGANRMAI